MISLGNSSGKGRVLEEAELRKFQEIGDQIQAITKTFELTYAGLRSFAAKAGLEIFSAENEGLIVYAAFQAQFVTEAILRLMGEWVIDAIADATVEQKMPDLMAQAFRLSSSGIRITLASALASKEITYDAGIVGAYRDSSVADMLERAPIFYPIRRKSVVIGIAYVDYSRIEIFLKRFLAVKPMEGVSVDRQIAVAQEHFLDTFMSPPAVAVHPTDHPKQRPPRRGIQCP